MTRINVRRTSVAEGSAEPVSCDDLMAWARVTDEGERRVLERLITVAREEVERFTGYVLIPGTFLLTTQFATRVELPLIPITEISEVRTLDAYGEIATLDVTSYDAALSVAPAVLVIYGYTYGAGGMDVEVEAGYGAGESVPQELRQAVLDVALLHYTHRDDPALLTRVHAYLGTLSTTFGIVQA